MNQADKTSEILAQMRVLIEKIHQQSDGTQEKRSANVIKKEMDKIITKEGGNKLLLGKRYEQLENALRGSEQNAQYTRNSYQQLKNKLFKMSDQLARLQRSIIPSVDEFSSDPDEENFRKAMQPWVELINPFYTSLDKLENRRAELEAELPAIVPKNNPLSEDDLLNDNIDEHTSSAIKTEEQTREFEVTCELLDKIETTITLRKAQIADLQQCFIEALSTFIDAYTTVGLRKTARDLKAMLHANSIYRKRVTGICSEISAEVGAPPDVAFFRTERTPPARMDIFFNDRETIRTIEKFTKEHDPR